MSRWGGSASRRARAVCEPLVLAGVACARCRKPIRPGQAWHPDHLTERHYGGTDEPANLWPSHARCNTRAGGQLGAKITNARRRARHQITAASMPAESVRGIRGV